MSQHSYTQCWLHMIWGTYERQKILERDARKLTSWYLTEYARENQIYMKINYVNPDHVHALVDLPTHLSIEKLFQGMKGSSSRWISQKQLTSRNFAWGRGFAAFSVSNSAASRVARYIANQEEHHRKKSFEEELADSIQQEGLIVIQDRI